ncbi:YggT family protein [Parerythrobacter jejuensis]|uniref:YggT family protein n=1 Tax=Parerythrobacter jejuensis TaxID=795812 RepID=A0A845AWT0_9SPHN|nr:YggT family protein [Parerythrobacter jejuensis]MXP31238.1 YggT family protein [Parerythrobacter jejuensis]MXP33998.1 YggT family protein [Parerythrobacter jejuensis]
MFLYTLIQIIELLTNVLVMLVIVQFVIGLLLAFNVINTSNDFVLAIYRSINSLLEPVLGPIRRILPGTGSIDFSPLVLIILLQVMLIVLTNVAIAAQ